MSDVLNGLQALSDCKYRRVWGQLSTATSDDSFGVLLSRRWAEMLGDLALWIMAQAARRGRRARARAAPGPEPKAGSGGIIKSGYS
jgi:hypothetical protein